jgi:hypothetical protein
MPDRNGIEVILALRSRRLARARELITAHPH